MVVQYTLRTISYVKTHRYTEAVGQRCSEKMLFLKISQNSQENTCARVPFLKKRLWYNCFPFFTEHLWWLFLSMTSSITKSYLNWLSKKTESCRFVLSSAKYFGILGKA